ncbi:MAG TPA: trigger factor, partial [Anaerolineales bacterium]|nr:trigger factor [Anaerolineales bacterium]
MAPLKIETQDLAERQKQLTVEVPEDQIEAAMHRAARRMSQRAKIAGFRPGKAPYEVVLQRYGEEAVFDEALETLGQDVYRQALEDSSLEAAAPGALEDVVSRRPLVLRYTVPLAPEIDLGKYRELRLPFEGAAVQEEAVDEVVEGLRQQQALIEPAERPARDSDVVVLDVHGHLADPGEGQNAVLMDEHGLSVLVAESTDFPFPGAAVHLLGMTAGEDRQAEYTFPADYRNESLRGRRADFAFHCQSVKSRTIPEWSDELARTMGDFTDQADLRAKVRHSLEVQSQRRAEAEYADRVIDAVVSGSKISFPPVLLRQEVDETMEDLERRLKDQRLSLADYLKIEKKEEADLRRDLEPQARRRLERALALGQVVEDEQLAVEEAEIDEALARLIEPLNDSADAVRRALDTPAGRQRLRLDLLTDKAVARLVQIARGEDPAKG